MSRPEEADDSDYSKETRLAEATDCPNAPQRQNGFVTARITMPIMSTVGTSLAIR
jgi:hypothetical protein